MRWSWPPVTALYQQGHCWQSRWILLVIILETGVKSRPQLSVAVHVSVAVPPQALGVAEK
jgi:hypothetical protein